jgi:hypothetical protein
MHTVQAHFKKKSPSSKDLHQIKVYWQDDAVPTVKLKSESVVKLIHNKKKIIKTRGQKSILRELGTPYKIGKKGVFLPEETAMLVDQILQGIFHNTKIARRSVSTMQKLESIVNGLHFSQKSFIHSDIVDVQSREPIVLTLTSQEVQRRRDEVRAMERAGKPKNGIPLYPGKKAAPDAVVFFKEHYADYIVPGQEVIFASELMAIDPPLIRALRNECRNPSTPMPIGTVEDRTLARNAGRFFDGHAAAVSTKSAMARKAKQVVELVD